MTLRSKTFVGAAVVAALMVGPVMTGTALAKKRESVKASLSSGGKFSATKKKYLIAAYSAPGNVVTLSGTSIKKRGRNVTTRNLNIGCSADIVTGTLPITVSCASQYTETGIQGFAPFARSWAAEGINVTFTGYDGSRVTGTFEGTLVDNSGGLAPQTFSGGTFSLVLDAQ